MEIESLLYELGIPFYSSCQEVYGGKDSKVFKVNVQQGVTFALRLLSRERHQQFIKEKKMIELAIANGVPVPKVHGIMKHNHFSAMLMEWGIGQTVFEELKEHPEIAQELGYEFGKVQASINGISLSKFEEESPSWLSPSMEEKLILNKVPKESLNNNLLHLDYHPLNVLTDGKKITAVIDWANASVGDYRFDLSRTLSILQLEGTKHFKHSDAINQFVEGWREGYEEEIGPFYSIEFLPLFNAWSGLRMKRDLTGTLLESDYINIQKWVTGWLNQT